VNFIPINWIVMIGLAIATIIVTQKARDGLVNSNVPMALPFQEAIGRKDLTNRFVSVSGILVPEASQTFIRSSRRHGDKVEAVYVPFFTEDKATPMLFVQYSEALAEKTAHQATATGMLRSPDSRLVEKAPQIQKRFAPSTFDLANVLVAGEQPGSPWQYVALAVTFGFLCVSMLYARFAHFVPAAIPEDPLTSRASRLMEDERYRKAIHVVENARGGGKTDEKAAFAAAVGFLQKQGIPVDEAETNLRLILGEVDRDEEEGLSDPPSDDDRDGWADRELGTREHLGPYREPSKADQRDSKAWELKMLLKRANAHESRGELKPMLDCLEQFIAKADDTAQIEKARTLAASVRAQLAEQGADRAP
jgi:hypothetical protein